MHALCFNVLSLHRYSNMVSTHRVHGIRLPIWSDLATVRMWDCWFCIIFRLYQSHQLLNLRWASLRVPYASHLINWKVYWLEESLPLHLLWYLMIQSHRNQLLLRRRLPLQNFIYCHVDWTHLVSFTCTLVVVYFHFSANLSQSKVFEQISFCTECNMMEFILRISKHYAPKNDRQC